MRRAEDGLFEDTAQRRRPSPAMTRTSLGGVNLCYGGGDGATDRLNLPCGGGKCRVSVDLRYVSPMVILG